MEELYGVLGQPLYESDNDQFRGFQIFDISREWLRLRIFLLFILNPLSSVIVSE